MENPFHPTTATIGYHSDLHLVRDSRLLYVSFTKPLHRGVPESPRWLISKDRSEEAWEILVKYHGEGDPNSEFVKAEYSEMKATIAMDLESKNRTWLELVSTKANLKRCGLVAFIGVFSQWSGNGLVSYYLSRVLETVGITNKRMQNKVGSRIQ